MLHLSTPHQLPFSPTLVTASVHTFLTTDFNKLGNMDSILGCLCGPWDAPSHPATAAHYQYSAITEKPPVQARPTLDKTPPRNLDDVTAEIIALLRRAEKSGTALAEQLNDTVGTAGWSERLAERVLHALEATLEGGREKWGEVLTDTYECSLKTAQEVFWELAQYVKEHPLEIAASVLLSLVAFGVLARLAPVVLELLGFGVEGPVEGSFAAWFMSTYGAHVPKGSLMAFLQRLGMTWRKRV
ncbi:hypothetical protein B0T25DRAFT_547043 [Lasiosphaeria hispida]|uniref:Lincomycin-condensing protein lmbA n=1 Tax=Lasiosphaeria hispida TaxID=260671 RepID=A0AAJ0HDW4_9PEZI|nr:hypothetical protein B0T25DRAFT_547043 [Lasiosphaeria hispida]